MKTISVAVAGIFRVDAAHVGAGLGLQIVGARVGLRF